MRTHNSFFAELEKLGGLHRIPNYLWAALSIPAVASAYKVIHRKRSKRTLDLPEASARVRTPVGMAYLAATSPEAVKLLKAYKVESPSFV
jgi:hypothetical protein